MRGGMVLAAAATVLLAAPAAGGEGTPGGRDDTVWLQARLDAGQSIVLPQLANGECYATRGLWITRDDTRIVSDGACIVGLGPGEVRIKSPDSDPIAAEAVFYVSRDNPYVPAPARISISGVRIRIPDDVELYGIAVYGHEVAVQNVEVSGAPIDAVIVGGRANDGFAARVSITDSRLLAGRRNVLSAVGAVDLRIERNVISGASDTYESNPGRPWGNPAAGIDLEPGGRGSPALGVRIADNEIVDNAGPGILLALSTNWGRPVLGDAIEIVGNRILRNGLKPTPPQHGGIVFNGGQDEGGGRVLVENNVISGNRGAALQGRWDVNLAIDQRGNDLSGNSGGALRGTRPHDLG